MLYKNHLVVSTAVALPIMSATNTLTVTNVLALSIGALLPDIDEPHSYIGRRTRGISDLIHLIFKHRGITHSIFFVGLINFSLIALGTKFGFATEATYLTLGSFLHILEDSFSKSGVKWLLPLSDKSFQCGIYYTTGGIVEYGIGILALFVILYQVMNYDYSFSQSTFLSQFNFTDTVLYFRDKVGEFVMK